MPFLQIAILSTFHCDNLSFFQFAILSDCHFIKMPFCLLDTSFNFSFINLTLIWIGLFFQHAVSTFYCGILSFCHLATVSNCDFIKIRIKAFFCVWHFINFIGHQLGIDITCHFVKILFHQLADVIIVILYSLSTCCFIKLPFH